MEIRTFYGDVKINVKIMKGKIQEVSCNDDLYGYKTEIYFINHLGERVLIKDDDVLTSFMHGEVKI